MEEIKEIIQDLYSTKQMFQSYEKLVQNESFRVNPKIFRKCVGKIDELIIITKKGVIK